jgi:CheY-like chemotaxis protein
MVNVSASKILVVEDEASISNLVVSYLRKEGYEVFSASDGTAGLKASRSIKPDLIVLDIMLPGMDGLEVLAQSPSTFHRSNLPTPSPMSALFDMGEGWGGGVFFFAKERREPT